MNLPSRISSYRLLSDGLVHQKDTKGRDVVCHNVDGHGYISATLREASRTPSLGT